MYKQGSGDEDGSPGTEADEVRPASPDRMVSTSFNIKPAWMLVDLLVDFLLLDMICGNSLVILGGVQIEPQWHRGTDRILTIWQV